MIMIMLPHAIRKPNATTFPQNQMSPQRMSQMNSLAPAPTSSITPAETPPPPVALIPVASGSVAVTSTMPPMFPTHSQQPATIPQPRPLFQAPNPPVPVPSAPYVTLPTPFSTQIQLMRQSKQQQQQPIQPGALNLNPASAPIHAAVSSIYAAVSSISSITPPTSFLTPLQLMQQSQQQQPQQQQPVLSGALNFLMQRKPIQPTQPIQPPQPMQQVSVQQRPTLLPVAQQAPVLPMKPTTQQPPVTSVHQGAYPLDPAAAAQSSPAVAIHRPEAPSSAAQQPPKATAGGMQVFKGIFGGRYSAAPEPQQHLMNQARSSDRISGDGKEQHQHQQQLRVGDSKPISEKAPAAEPRQGQEQRQQVSGSKASVAVPQKTAPGVGTSVAPSSATPKPAPPKPAPAAVPSQPDATAPLARTGPPPPLSLPKPDHEARNIALKTLELDTPFSVLADAADRGAEAMSGHKLVISCRLIKDLFSAVSWLCK